MTLDLIDQTELILEYENYHQEVWPDVRKSILAAGVKQMEIYRFGNRLMMIMDVGDKFSFERKVHMDANNPTVQEWEKLMWKYQQAIPGAKPGQKWVLMEKIFELV